MKIRRYVTFVFVLLPSTYYAEPYIAFRTALQIFIPLWIKF